MWPHWMWPYRKPSAEEYLAAFRTSSGAATFNTLQPPEPCYVDVHCHSTLMPFNRLAKYDPLSDQVETADNDKLFWPEPASADKVERRKRFHGTPAFYQCDFTALSRGNVRIALVSLYPLEQGFVEAGRGGDRLLGEVQVLEELLEGFGKLGARLLYKIPAARTKQLQAYEHQYFKDLEAEFGVLTNDAYWKCPGREGVLAGARAQVVGNYGELEPLLEQRNVTAAIVTVEGGHSLGSGSLEWRANIDDNKLLDRLSPKVTEPEFSRLFDQLKLNDVSSKMTDAEFDRLLDDEALAGYPTGDSEMVQRFRVEAVRELVLELLQNIWRMKRWGPEGKYAPFSITFSHQFWNQLCGHAISLPYPVFGQQRGIELPMTEVGKVVVSALLSKKNGRRVLLDTKHMSLAGKRWYYERVKGKKIPIISSHAAVSGIPCMPDPPTTRSCRVADKNYTRTTDFNSWDINLSDEEIRTIHQSDGLIGLNFDERILTGWERNKDLHGRAPSGPHWAARTYGWSRLPTSSIDSRKQFRRVPT